MTAMMKHILSGLFVLAFASVAFAAPTQFGAGGARVVVPTVTSDAYNIPLEYASPAVILSNTSDTDADVWTLPDCDTAASAGGQAPYPATMSTIGAVVQVFVNAAAQVALSPVATDQIAQLTGAVDVDIEAQDIGSYVRLVCVADNLWVPTESKGFYGDGTQQLNGRVAVPKAATDTTIAVSEGGAFQVFTNTGASGIIEITLPDCVTATIGVEFHFAGVIATHNIEVLWTDDANTLAVIEGVALDAGDEVDIIPYSKASFRCVAADRWEVTGGGVDGGAT